MHPLDSLPLGFADRRLDLLEGLSLLEPVQDLLGAGLHAERQKIAVGLAHERKLVHGRGIHPAFATPAERQLARR